MPVGLKFQREHEIREVIFAVKIYRCFSEMETKKLFN